MSHNYPYRVPPPHADMRPERGASTPPDGRHPSGNGSYAPPYSAPASAAATRNSAVPQENVLSLLSSCGLEPEDLARLAELPEDVLTVESLPHILQQMKGKKGAVKPHPPASTSASSFHSSSTSRPDINWEQLRTQPVQYPLISSTRLPPEKGQEHWGSPRTSSSVRTEPPLPSSSSSSSGYMVDTDVRAGPPKYGKTDPVPSFSPVGQRLGSSHFSESGPTVRQAPYHRPKPPPPHPHPPPPQHPTNKCDKRHQKSGSSSSRSSQPPSSIPSMKQALDFHGTPPSVFPYACSLCDITVLSEKVWTQHINSTLHADGQLKLLQEFPTWDCRVKTLKSNDGQSQSHGKKGNPASDACPANQSRAATQSSKNNQKKAKGKVVCVKFPPQSVDETYLRKLTEPFGKIVKILMFPSLAFVELGSVDQANDLVKFHVNYPPTVNGSQIDFSISSTFSFLQSSQVVSFTPAPAGEDGRSDLVSIVKRFGVPLYTLFLPSKAYVEMKSVAEAQKLVDYYSSNVLRISDDSIRVSFSGEYKSLARISSAKRYEEQPVPTTTKRTRTRSRSRSRSRSRGKRTRTRSKSREKREKEQRNRTRSKSADKSNKERRTRTRSRSRERRTTTRSRSRERRTTTRSRSRDKSNREKQTTARSRSKSQSDSRETSNQKSRSRSRDSPSREKQTRSRSKSRSRDKSSGPSNTETKSGSKETSEEPKEPAAGEPAPVEQSEPKAAGTVLMEEEDEEDDEGLSVDDSDIEGMEVIAEDGEEVEDEDEEELEEEDEEQEDDEEEQSPAVKTQSSEHGDEGKEEEEGKKEEEEVKKEEEVKTEEEEVKKEEEEVKKEEEEVKKEEEEVKKEEEEVKKEEAKEEKEKEEEEVKKDEKPDAREETEAEEEKIGKSQEESQIPLEEEDEAFPVDPENFITLDELGEDECGESGEEAAVVHESEPDSSRVIYIRNLPPRFYTDAEFLDVLRGCGTAVRYLLIRSRREGFVEMSTPSEAAKAARELNSRPVLLNKSKLDFIVSRKYFRLTSGWPVKLEADSESRSSRRSRRRRDASKKSPERESRREPGRKSPEQELRNISEEQSASRETLNLKETAEETQPRIESPEVEALQRTEGLQEETQQKTDRPEEEAQPRTESLQEEMRQRTESPPDEVMNTPEKEELPQINVSPEEETRGKKGPESQEEKEKTPEHESGPQTDPRSAEQPPEAEEKDETRKTADEKLQDGLIKDKEEKSTEEELKKDSDAAQKPSKPVGVEFVRPVVGYFCNLCQLIYADEDEAKQEHCRTPEHYRRYQEKTGKDPWTS